MRPVSAWLVLVLVATLFFQSDAPILLHEVALLIAVIPVLRLLPKDVFEVLGAVAVRRHGALRAATAGRSCSSPTPLASSRAPAGRDAARAGGAALDPACRRDAACRRHSATARRSARRGLVGLARVSCCSRCPSPPTCSATCRSPKLLTRGTLDSGYLGLVLYAGATVLGVDCAARARASPIGTHSRRRRARGPLLRDPRAIHQVCGDRRLGAGDAERSSACCGRSWSWTRRVLDVRVRLSARSR